MKTTFADIIFDEMSRKVEDKPFILKRSTYHEGADEITLRHRDVIYQQLLVTIHDNYCLVDENNNPVGFERAFNSIRSQECL